MTPRRLFGLALAAWVVAVGLGLVFGAPLTGDESAYALLARGVDVGLAVSPARDGRHRRRPGSALGGSTRSAMRLAPTRCSSARVRRSPSPRSAAARSARGSPRGRRCIVAGSHAFVLRAPRAARRSARARPACSRRSRSCSASSPRAGRPALPARRRRARCSPAAFYLRYGSAPGDRDDRRASRAIAWWRVGVVAARADARDDRRCSPRSSCRSRSRRARATGSVTRDPASCRARVREPRSARARPARARARQPVPAVRRARPGRGAARGARVATRGGRLPAPAAHDAGASPRLALGQIVAIGLVGHGRDPATSSSRSRCSSCSASICSRACTPHARTSRSSCRASPAASPRSRGSCSSALQPHIQGTLAAGLSDVIADAHAIRDDAAGRPCTVAALAVPQLMWYSGCDGVKLGAPGTPVDPPRGSPAGVRGLDRRTEARSTPPVLGAEHPGRRAGRAAGAERVVPPPALTPPTTSRRAGPVIAWEGDGSRAATTRPRVGSSCAQICRVACATTCASSSCSSRRCTITTATRTRCSPAISSTARISIRRTGRTSSASSTATRRAR